MIDGTAGSGSAPDPTTWSCPVPLAGHDRIVAGHGGGGRMTDDLVRHLIVPAFGPAGASPGLDAAVLDLPETRVAFTTDAHVVQPLEFPGGSIGDLAVNGTVNDLAVMGAEPVWLSVAMVLEEGLELESLSRIAGHMGAAATEAGVTLVTGDTKVVERTSGDGMSVTTSGIGVVSPGVDVGPHRITPGDRVILSGPLARHGIAVLSRRDNLSFEATVTSDTRPLHRMTASMAERCGDGLHAMRDATRGGLAAVLCELAEQADVGIEIREDLIPVPSDVRAACTMLGLDPLHVANEGVLVAVVDQAVEERCVDVMRTTAAGAGSLTIGHVTDAHPSVVGQVTSLGATRVIDRPMGEQLPRIC